MAGTRGASTSLGTGTVGRGGLARQGGDDAPDARQVVDFCGAGLLAALLVALGTPVLAALVL